MKPSPSLSESYYIANAIGINMIAIYLSLVKRYSGNQTCYVLPSSLPEKRSKLDLHFCLFILGFHQACYQTKNRKHSVNKAKNPGYDRCMRQKKPC